MFKLQNFIFSFGLFFFSVLIVLFSTGILQWNSSFGPAEAVNLIVAFLTFGVVFISYKSILIANKAADLTKKQFDLNHEQYEREKSPKIIPLGDTYEKKPIPIFREFYSQKFLDFSKGDFEIEIINVGRGTAYSVQAQLKLSNIESYKSQSSFKNPIVYSQLNDHSYEIFFENDSMEVIDNILSPECSSPALELKNFEMVTHKSVLYAKEKLTIAISSYLQTILTHEIYYRFGLGFLEAEELERVPEYITPLFTISLKFKTESQLGTPDWSFFDFEVTFNDFKIVDISGTISFRLDYELIMAPLE